MLFVRLSILAARSDTSGETFDPKVDARSPRSKIQDGWGENSDP